MQVPDWQKVESSRVLEIQGCKAPRFKGYKAPGIQGCRFPWFQSSKISEFRACRVPEQKPFAGDLAGSFRNSMMHIVSMYMRLHVRVL